MKQAGFIEQLKGTPGMALGEHSRKFIANPLARDLMNLGCELPDRSESCRLNRVLKTRGEPDCAQHAQCVFAKAKCGISNCTNNFCIEVLPPADKIQHFVLHRIEQQAVNGEVAALNIFARITAETDFIGMAAVGISHITTKRRHFNTGFVMMAKKSSLFIG